MNTKTDKAEKLSKTLLFPSSVSSGVRSKKSKKPGVRCKKSKNDRYEGSCWMYKEKNEVDKKNEKGRQKIRGKVK